MVKLAKFPTICNYAVESYQSLYLKVYYPIEFAVSTINSHGGFYRTEVYAHEAKRAGATINTPCVNNSCYETTAIDKNIYLGFKHLEKFEGRIALHIEKERERNGLFKSMEDFINRIPIGIESIQTLIFIGAFRFTGKQKNELLLAARFILVNYKPDNRNLLLLQEPVKEYKLPKLERAEFEDAFDEIEILGFPVSCTMFDLMETKYRGDVLAKDLLNHHKKMVKMLAYLISRKQVPTKKGLMYFGTWIDAQGEYFDTAHFPNSLEVYPFQEGVFIYCSVKLRLIFIFPPLQLPKWLRCL